MREQLEVETLPAAQRMIRQATPRVMNAIDINSLLEAIDLNALLEHVDMDRLIAQLDMEKLLERIDIGQIIDRVDIDAIVGRIDIDAIVAKIDIDAIVGGMDINAIVDKVDINAIVDKVDIEAIISKIDIDALVTQTELGGIIAKSTSGIASSALDSVRSQGVGLDGFVHRWTNRILRRDPPSCRQGRRCSFARAFRPPRHRSLGPPPARHRRGGQHHRPARGCAVRQRGNAPMTTVARPDLSVSQQGHYAGVVTRLVALIIDQTTAALVLALALKLTEGAIDIVAEGEYHLDLPPWLAASISAVWFFIYYAYSSGREREDVRLGAARPSGRHDERRSPRTSSGRDPDIGAPLSLLTFGLGFLLALVHRERKALQDVIAGTVVVYDWDARSTASSGSSRHSVTRPRPPGRRPRRRPRRIRSSGARAGASHRRPVPRPSPACRRNGPGGVYGSAASRSTW